MQITGITGKCLVEALSRKINSKRCVSLAGKKYIDRFTFGRINDPSSVDGLANCACEMAEAVYELKYRDGEKSRKVREHGRILRDLSDGTERR